MTTATPSETATPLSADELDRFYMVLGGHIYFQTLSAAVELGLFDLLHDRGGLSRAEISHSLGLEEKPARILLLGCTSLGLLQKSGTAYSNTAVTEALLVRDVPGNLVPVVRWQNHINYRPMSSLLDALRANRNVGLEQLAGSGDTLYERLSHNPELEQIFQEAMQSISTQANAMLADAVNLSDIRHLVDVGGGNGSNVITLARRFPHLRVTVFDSPSVCEIAEQNLRDAGLADRAFAVVGDCFRDPLPEDADCFLFCHFLTIWSERQNRELLQKAYDALPPGGKVILFNMMQSDSEDGPLTAAMGSPYLLTLATGQGMLYPWREYEEWLAVAGFVDFDRQTLPKDHGVIIAAKQS